MLEMGEGLEARGGPRTEFEYNSEMFYISNTFVIMAFTAQHIFICDIIIAIS